VPWAETDVDKEATPATTNNEQRRVFI